MAGLLSWEGDAEKTFEQRVSNANTQQRIKRDTEHNEPRERSKSAKRND